MLDFLGQELVIGDYVIYTQRKIKCGPLGCGIIVADDIPEKDRQWEFSVMVERLKPHARGKYSTKFPAAACELVKIPKEELTLMILERGSKFLQK